MITWEAEAFLQQEYPDLLQVQDCFSIPSINSKAYFPEFFDKECILPFEGVSKRSKENDSNSMDWSPDKSKKTKLQKLNNQINNEPILNEEPVVEPNPKKSEVVRSEKVAEPVKKVEKEAYHEEEEQEDEEDEDEEGYFIVEKILDKRSSHVKKILHIFSVY
jgi:hypothetical protein